MVPRANALGILLRGEQILLEEQDGRHSRGTGIFYRPLGGTIEFGEQSRETVVREYKEEIGMDIEVQQYITCIENIYRIGDHAGHEITQIYVVNFCDESFYKQECFEVVEGNKTTYAKWISLSEIVENRVVVYPNGLDQLLLKIQLECVR